MGELTHPTIKGSSLFPSTFTSPCCDGFQLKPEHLYLIILGGLNGCGISN